MMENKYIRRFMAAALGAPLLAAAMPVQAENDARNKSLIVQGEVQSIADGKASIKIAPTLLEFFQFAALRPPRTIILFDGNRENAEERCPYLDLADRDYEARQIHPENRIYKVTAAVSEDEIAAIRDANCVITRTIRRAEIKPYQPD